MKTGYDYSFVPEPSGRAFTHLGKLVNDALRTQFGKSDAELAKEEEALMLVRMSESELETYEALPPEIKTAFSSRVQRPLPLSREDLSNRLRVKLANKLDEMMMVAIGFEQKYGESRIKDGSVVASELLVIAKEEAKNVIAGWLTQGSLKKIVDKAIADGPGKEVLSKFEYRLQEEVDALLRKRAASMAEVMVNHIREDVLNAALNKAMLERYPELANLEAFDRLAGDE